MTGIMARTLWLYLIFKNAELRAGYQATKILGYKVTLTPGVSLHCVVEEIR